MKALTINVPFKLTVAAFIDRCVVMSPSNTLSLLRGFNARLTAMNTKKKDFHQLKYAEDLTFFLYYIRLVAVTHQ